jgi:hypothetical protein
MTQSDRLRSGHPQNRQVPLSPSLISSLTLTPTLPVCAHFAPLESTLEFSKTRPRPFKPTVTRGAPPTPVELVPAKASFLPHR